MTEATGDTDAALVREAARGSEYAFRRLYRAYARPVYWIAHALVGNGPDAEDVMQETFVVAWRKLRHLELEGDSLLPWLATICRFQSANRLRSRRRERQHVAGSLDDTVPDTVAVEEQVIAGDVAERILAAVGSLGEVDREVFRLCATEGYGYEAAARELGISHAAVRNRLSRVRTRLRSVLRETEG